MAKGLAEAGAKVAILGRRKEAGEKVVAEIKRAGKEAIAVSADVCNKEQLQEAGEKILSTFGTIDILVNAAGGNLPGTVIPPEKNFYDLNVEDFQKVLDLNLTGTVLPTFVFSEVMAKQRKGIIINISSISSFRPLTRVVGYSAAKAGINNFTHWLATEMALKFGEGIRVNAIAPGFFLAEQNKALLVNPDESLTPRGQAVINNTPLRRFGRPEELVGTLVWLCSDASSFVTGIVVPVDGGFTAFPGV
jgi:NAD(P)-dependent dehydrogenase (short-subunit alcohol dehydrogenase family)